MASAKVIEPINTDAESNTGSQAASESRQPIELPDLTQSGLVMIETAPDKIAEVPEEALAPVKRPRIRPSYLAEPDTTSSEPLVQIETRD